MDGVTGEVRVCLKLRQWHRDLYRILCGMPVNIRVARNLLWFSNWLRRYKEIFSEMDNFVCIKQNCLLLRLFCKNENQLYNIIHVILNNQALIL